MYSALQPELMELMERKTELLNGGRSSRAAATRGSDVPASAAQYPNLPADSDSRDAWSAAKSELQQAGITVEQSRVLGRLVLQAELDAAERRDAAVAERHAAGKRELARAYGADWRRDVTAGNERARALLPNGQARELFLLRLEDGSLLGDHHLTARLFIEMARAR
jgi:hypothetical protein